MIFPQNLTTVKNRLNFQNLSPANQAIVLQRWQEPATYALPEVQEELNTFVPPIHSRTCGPYKVEWKLDVAEEISRTPDLKAVPNTTKQRASPGSLTLRGTGAVRISVQQGGGHLKSIPGQAHDWKIGYIQQINAFTRKIYGPVSPTHYKRQTITLPTPIRDCPPADQDTTPPFYDQGARNEISRSYTPLTGMNIVRFFDDPSIDIPPPDPAAAGAIQGVWQRVTFTTWLVLLRADRFCGLVLGRWDWKASFALFDRLKDGIRLRRGGLAVTARDPMVSDSLPQVPDTPRGKDALRAQVLVAPVSAKMDAAAVQAECCDPFV